jgi:hypothetical protein
MDWALRIRKDVQSWVLKLVLVVSILTVAGLQQFDVI